MHRNFSELTARVLVFASVRYPTTDDSVYQSKSGLPTPGFQQVPAQTDQHVGDAAASSVVLLDEVCSSPLVVLYEVLKACPWSGYGSHTEQAYSSFDRTIAWRASSRSSVGHLFRFLRKNPKFLLVLAQMVLICAFHCRSSLRVTMRYFEVSTLLRTHTQR